MPSKKRGRPEVISAETRWKIRTKYVEKHGEWGPGPLKYWAQSEKLGSYSPTTIAKIVADLRPEKKKRKGTKGYEIAEPMVMMSQDATAFYQNGGKQEAMVLQDECSRFKVSCRLKNGTMNERVVLKHLRAAFEKHGAPLVLKQDNIAYQNTEAILQLCEEHDVVLITSPPGYPPYNGKKERSMRDIKSFERALRRDGDRGPLGKRLKIAIQDLNEERPRPMLSGRTAREVFEDRKRKLPDRKRFKLMVQTRQMELEEKSKTKWEFLAARRKAVEQVLLHYDLLNWKGDTSTNLTAQSGTN